MHVIVMAKSPVPGRVKTRMCPPCTPDAAAAIAAASIADTLETARRVPGVRTVLATDGPPPAFLPDGVEVIPQRGDGLAARIAAALADVGGPSLVIGMDTPQLRVAGLTDACSRLVSRGTGAVLGPALDGGWWVLGLRRPDASALSSVPMSSPRTFERQRARLRSLGLTVAELPAMRDVDTAADALEVARQIPRSRFAHAVAAGGIPVARASG
jgi:rSAM/selenodomain-associated transferase 1